MRERGGNKRDLTGGGWEKLKSRSEATLLTSSQVIYYLPDSSTVSLAFPISLSAKQV